MRWQRELYTSTSVHHTCFSSYNFSVFVDEHFSVFPSRAVSRWCCYPLICQMFLIFFFLLVPKCKVQIWIIRHINKMITGIRTGKVTRKTVCCCCCFLLCFTFLLKYIKRKSKLQTTASIEDVVSSYTPPSNSRHYA